MRVLITGASGLIGQKLIEHLQKFNYSPFLLINDDKIDLGESRGLRGDLCDKLSLLRATKDVDAIIHLAGVTHTNNQELYYRVNTGGTKNLLEAARINRVRRFIYISSRAAVMDGGAYSHSKYLAEAAVKKSDLDWIILQPAEVYGAGGKEVISQLVKIIKKHYVVPIIGSGNYMLSPVWVDDVIGAIISSLNNKNLNRKTYILAGPEELSYNQIVNIISNVLHARRIRVYLPIIIIKFLALIFFLIRKNYIVRDQIPRLLCRKSSDIRLARQDLGFNPIPFTTGIKKLIK